MSSPSTTPNSMSPPQGLSCPHCKNWLIPRLTKSGLAPNTYLAQCLNPNHRPFNFRYGPEFSPPAPTAAQPHAPSVVSPRCPHKTNGNQCKSTRINTLCSQKKCKKHCRNSGGCVLRLHSSSTPSARIVSPTFAPRLAQPAHHTAPDTWGLGFSDLFKDVGQPLQARLKEAEHLLDLAIGMDRLPMSPELLVHDELARMEREQDDRTFAFCLSEELNAAPRRPSVEPPLSIPPATTNGAASLRQTNTLSSPQAPPASQPTPPPSAVLHVRQSGNRHPFADPRQIKRFTLLYLTGGAPHIISVDASQLTAVPWPSYQLSTDHKTCWSIGDDLQPDLELFLERQRMWMVIDIDHIHAGLTTDGVIVLRRRGHPGAKDDELIDKFLPATTTTTTVSHLRYNLKGECSAVCSALSKVKSGAPLIILSDDSDNELEVSAVTTSVPPRKRRIKSHGDINPHLPQRPRLAIDTNVDVVGTIPSTTTTDSAPPSVLSLFSPSISSASEPSTPIEAPKWPDGMYTVDVIAGFLRMDSEELAHMKNRAAKFFHIFDRIYKSSTYDNNLKQWKAVSSVLQQRSLDAGWTKDGLWAVFRTHLNAEHAGKAV
ncbi:hypothetical protein B0H16DRAFT_1829511 [Mycena metata]|uniref:Uncharacterized protein n=1 Tax=Mycena metata TaxID=1033252 RepID=A0AAD7GRQ5_9AGAR|nr:hypothetical protein B0H16DRAFT_1829511 [Mycena metata]